jgi:DNA-binding MarR family transcriptional regulator
MVREARADLAPSIERATHAIAVWIESALREEGITQAEAHILGYLSDIGRCSINELHRDLGHRRSTLTSILDRLERRELVRRAQHPTSRRSVMVELTERGRVAAQQVSRLLDQLEGAVQRATTPEDREGFNRVLEAIEEVTHDGR